MLLPGAVLPAEQAYADLRSVLGPGVEAVAKDLELYGEDIPAADYSLDREVDGILREADARGWDQFPSWAPRRGVRRRWLRRLRSSPGCSAWPSSS
jgi:hypothetical protein